jgi:plasmid stabilization system protein ParE
LVTGYEAQGLRRRRHGNYLIFYVIDASRLVVIHVLHGARDHDAILFPEPF